MKRIPEIRAAGNTQPGGTAPNPRTQLNRAIASLSLSDLSLPYNRTVANLRRDQPHPRTYMAAQILFFALATAAIAGALGMLISRNPVNSALWLILNLFCVAGLYLTLNAEFIAVVQVLVYAGAIMVLFLYVVMLLNLAALPDLKKIDGRRVLAYVLSMGLLAMLSFVVASSLDMLPVPGSLEAVAENGSASNLAKSLFVQFAMPVEVIGILLLAATIGAVMLAKRKAV